MLTSGNQLAAIVNILSAAFDAAGSFRYDSTGAATVYLPLLNHDNSGFTTWFTVQNLGDGAADVQVAYSDGTSATAVIGRDQSHVFHQARENHPQAVFGGVVTSDQPIFVYVLQENSEIIFAYTGFTSGTPNPVFPLINANNPNNHGYITGLQIQNAGASGTSVTVAYTPSVAGTACTETQVIEAGGSKTFALAAFEHGAPSTCAAKERFVGAARVSQNSANQPLIGIGNQLLPGVNGGVYAAFDPAQAKHKVVMPLIMDHNAGFSTGFNLQNVGEITATVDCTFSDQAYTLSRVLQPGEVSTDLQQNQIANGYVGGATCTASPSGARIVSVVNELGSNIEVDQLLVYEGVALE
jgi:hypothetical protein